MKTPSGRTTSGIASALVLALATPLAGAAQQVADFVPQAARASDFPLSIRSIMRGSELVGQAPAGVRWSEDGNWIYFSWLPGGSEWDADREQYRVRADGSGLEVVPEEERDELAIRLAGGDVSADGRRKVVSSGGDLYMVDLRSGSVQQLTDTREGEGSARFMADGGILYRSGMNLFRLMDGRVTQITDIRSGNAPREDDDPEGQRAFLADQQEELFEHIRRENARQAKREAEREAEMEGEPEPLFIPNGQRLGGLEASPDGSHVLVSTFSPAPDARGTMVPDWVTASGYTEELNVRTKVGDEQGSSRLGILTSATGDVTWVEAAPADYEGEAEWSVSDLGWNEAGTHALLWHRSDDDTEWVLTTLDAATGDLTEVAREYNEAWVGGACRFGCIGWVPETDRVYYVSEETGYAHVYTVAADGTGTRALTSGPWEVLSVDVLNEDQRDEVDATFLLTTNEGSPFNQHLAFMDRNGDREYLTAGDGRYEGTLSPNGERIAVQYDVANHPPELYVAEVDDLLDTDADPTAGPPSMSSGDPVTEAFPGAPAGAARALTRVTDTPTEEWKGFGWIRPEIVRFTARDGVEVPARIYRPGDVGGTPNGAAVVFVHGAGYLHNVHNYWSSYYREYMFHHLLAAQGYTVLDIDYRGSAGYGAEWRTGIYRFMGGKDLTDQEDGARWLVANEGIDADRIGLYGGSYGGFITLMALTTGDQVFKSGAALRSVTDWAHYNDGYTSNILNDPQEDREAYVRSSPIYHVENFRDDQHMLILHGMVDTNVHFSDVVRYAQRLIELGKENWEFAVYPVESHGFEEPTSWTDEYRRIFELFERTISEPGCTDGGALCAVPGR